jgi:hypothetical protein
VNNSDPFEASHTLSKIIKTNVTYEQLLKLDNETLLENYRISFGKDILNSDFINETKQTHKKNNSSMEELQKIVSQI